MTTKTTTPERLAKLALLAALALPAASETAIRPGTTARPEIVAPAQRDDSGRLLYRVSQAAFVAGRVADFASTPWNDPSAGRELNPLLANADGSYGARGLAIQAGITAGWLVGQELMLKYWGHHGWVRKAVTVVNFTGAGVGFGAAWHNGRTR